MTTATTSKTPSAPPRQAAKRPATGTDRTAGRRRSSTIIVTAILVVAALYFLIPVYWVFVASTKSTADLFSTNGFWFAPTFALTENLSKVLSYDGGIFGRWFLNSAIYAGVGALPGHLLRRGGRLRPGQVPIPRAEPGVRHHPWWRPGTRNGHCPAAVPALQPNGPGQHVLECPVALLVSPFGLFLCRIYAEATVDTALIEAARIDGAGELRIFHTIGLKVLTPALVTVFLFQLVGIWNNYFLPLVMLSDSELYPITLGLNNWLSQVDRLPEFYELTTGGVLLSIIPLSIAMVVLQRFWRGGLTEGAVK